MKATIVFVFEVVLLACFLGMVSGMVWAISDGFDRIATSTNQELSR